jgi:hypothetical protein
MKKKNYTFQKAPMAHKTNSQEHFKMNFYKFKIRFKTRLKDGLTLENFENAKLFGIFVQKNLPVFETNFLYTTGLSLFYSFQAPRSLSYYGPKASKARKRH